MCEERQVVAPREVLREINRGNDELLSWAEDHIGIFLEPSEEEVTIIQQLFEYYPMEIRAKYSTRPWADPMVIACAKYYRLPIIQEESNDARQYKIPPLAAKLGVKCVRLVGFFEDAGWHFPAIRG